MVSLAGSTDGHLAGSTASLCVCVLCVMVSLAGSTDGHLAGSTASLCVCVLCV